MNCSFALLTDRSFVAEASDRMRAHHYSLNYLHAVKTQITSSGLCHII